MMDRLPIQLAGEHVELLADRALFWPRERTLFIADPHFGKGGAFRKLGLAVPDDTRPELARLTRLLSDTAAARLVILGDFLHARPGVTPRLLDLLGEWRADHAGVEMILVRGNHDRRAGDPPESLDIECVAEPWSLGPWACCHEPQEFAGRHTLAGHVHPGYALRGRGSSGVRSPCFWLRPACAVLPAFGAFTGLEVVVRSPEYRIVMVGENRLFEIPRSCETHPR